jgi:small conductance mechanosensitive channel
MKSRGNNVIDANARPVRAFLACLAITVLLAGFAVAQAQDTEAELQPLPQEVATGFDQQLTNIALQNVDIRALQGRIDTSEGLAAQVLEIRRDRIWILMFESTLALAKNVANLRDKGQDVSLYEQLLAGQLAERAPEAIVAIQRIRSQISFPTDDAPPEQFVLDDQKLFRLVRQVDNLYRDLISYVEVAERFELDASPAINFMNGSLTDAAANRSIFLELAIEDVSTLRASVATLPNNTDLADWLSAAEARVRMTAASMQQLITVMNTLDLDTRQYRQQVLTVTGEITTDVLDVGIMADLIKDWSTTAGRLVATEGPRLLFRLLLVIFILFVFFQFAKLVQKGVERGLNASGLHLSHLLRRMIVSTVRNLVVIFGVLIAISQLGISLGPLLAGLGIAGFIIGDLAVSALRCWGHGGCRWGQGKSKSYEPGQHDIHDIRQSETGCSKQQYLGSGHHQCHGATDEAGRPRVRHIV